MKSQGHAYLDGQLVLIYASTVNVQGVALAFVVGATSSQWCPIAHLSLVTWTIAN